LYSYNVYILALLRGYHAIAACILLVDDAIAWIIQAHELVQLPAVHVLTAAEDNCLQLNSFYELMLCLHLFSCATHLLLVGPWLTVVGP